MSDKTGKLRLVGGHYHDYQKMAAGMNQVEPLTITAVGDKAPGGAQNVYLISGFTMSDFDTPVPLPIIFHTGNPKDGWTGVTMEALVAIVVDRLKGLQDGSYPCFENDEAMRCFQEGLQHLHARTKRVEESLRVANIAAAEQLL